MSTTLYGKKENFPQCTCMRSDFCNFIVHFGCCERKCRYYCKRIRFSISYIVLWKQIQITISTKYSLYNGRCLNNGNWSTVYVLRLYKFWIMLQYHIWPPMTIETIIFVAFMYRYMLFRCSVALHRAHFLHSFNVNYIMKMRWTEWIVSLGNKKWHLEPMDIK